MRYITNVLFLIIAFSHFTIANSISVKSEQSAETKMASEINHLPTHGKSNADIAIIDMEIESIFVAGNVPITVKLRNMSEAIITEFIIGYDINNQPADEALVTNIEIAQFQSYYFTFPQEWEATPGNYTLKVSVQTVNGQPDNNPTDNEWSTDVTIASQSVTRTPLFEQFTSSYCGPCGDINTTVFTNEFTQNNIRNSTVIRYQTSFPGPDPYYIAANGVRMDYYPVNSVPKLFLDGTLAALTATEQLQGDLDNAIEKPAYVKIAANHEIDESTKTIQFNANITPFITIDNCRMYVAVIENTTYGNVGNNGETEFHHVNMKLHPNGYGTSLDFVAASPQSFNFNIDMNNTNVEEYSDLRVVVFIQNHLTKEILQSSYSTDLNALNQVIFDIQSQESPIENAEVQIDNQTIYTDANGMATVELVNGAYTYTVSKTGFEPYNGACTVENNTTDIAVELEPIIGLNSEVQMGLFPNPTNSFLHVKTDGVYQLSITSFTGIVFHRQRVENQSMVDLTHVPTGIYIVTISNNEKTISQKLLVR